MISPNKTVTQKMYKKRYQNIAVRNQLYKLLLIFRRPHRRQNPAQTTCVVKVVESRRTFPSINQRFVGSPLLKRASFVEMFRNRSNVKRSFVFETIGRPNFETGIRLVEFLRAL